MKKEKPKPEEVKFCEICRAKIKGKGGTVCSTKCASHWISMYLP